MSNESNECVFEGQVWRPLICVKCFHPKGSHTLFTPPSPAPAPSNTPTPSSAPRGSLKLSLRERGLISSPSPSATPERRPSKLSINSELVHSSPRNSITSESVSSSVKTQPSKAVAPEVITPLVRVVNTVPTFEPIIHHLPTLLATNHTTSDNSNNDNQHTGNDNNNSNQTVDSNQVTSNLNSNDNEDRALANSIVAVNQASTKNEDPQQNSDSNNLAAISKSEKEEEEPQSFPSETPTAEGSQAVPEAPLLQNIQNISPIIAQDTDDNANDNTNKDNTSNDNANTGNNNDENEVPIAPPFELITNKNVNNSSDENNNENSNSNESLSSQTDSQSQGQVGVGGDQAQAAQQARFNSLALISSGAFSLRKVSNSNNSNIRDTGIVIDFGSELQWKLQKKKRENLRERESSALSPIVRDQIDSIMRRVVQFGSATSVGELSTLRMIMSEVESFLSREELPATFFQTLNDFPNHKFEAMQNVHKYYDRFNNALAVASRYASNFILQKDKQTGDWVVLESDLIERAINGVVGTRRDLLDAIERCNINNPAVIQGGLNLGTEDIYTQAEQVCKTLVDLLLTKSLYNYGNIISTNNTNSFDSSSKSVKAYQLIQLVYSLSIKLSTPPVSICHWTPFEQSQFDDLNTKLKELSKRSSTAISIANRMGGWDIKEQVQLRKISASNSTANNTNTSGINNNNQNGYSISDKDLDHIRKYHSGLYECVCSTSGGSISDLLPETYSFQFPIDDQGAGLSDLFTLNQLNILVKSATVNRNLVALRELLIYSIKCFNNINNDDNPNVSTSTINNRLNDYRELRGSWLYESLPRYLDAFYIHLNPYQSFSTNNNAFTSEADDSNNNQGFDMDSLLNSININYRSPVNGCTSLHIASQNGLFNIIALLLEYKADPLIVNGQDRNPLHYLSIKYFPMPSVNTLSITNTSYLSHHGLFSSYFNSNEFSDVLLKLDDNTIIPAHKIILAAQSSVFKVMLSGKWATSNSSNYNNNSSNPASQNSISVSNNDSSQLGLDVDDYSSNDSLSNDNNDNNRNIILWPDVSKVVGDLIIKYLYSGEIVWIVSDLTIGAGLLKVSSRYLLDHLKKYIEIILIQQINIYNVLQLYTLSIHCDSFLLQQACAHVILEDYYKIFNIQIDSNKSNNNPSNNKNEMGASMSIEEDINGLRSALVTIIKNGPPSPSLTTP